MKEATNNQDQGSSKAVAHQALQKKGEGLSLAPPSRLGGETAAPLNPGGSSGGAPVQAKLFNKYQFIDATDGGTFRKRGSGVQKIDELVATYDSLQKNFYTVSKSDLEYVHGQIEENIRNWIDYHKDESGQQQRIANFERFLAGNWLEEKERIANRRPGNGEKDFNGKEIKKEDSAAVTKLKNQHEGTGDGLFRKLGSMVNTMVPNNGDTSELELAVKIPTGAGTLYVGGQIGLEAEKDDNNVKVSAEVDLLMGGKVPGVAEITGSLGSYVEAEGSSAAEAIELMSYGLYQKARASSVCPESLTNAMWGGGKTGSLGFAEAEKKNAERERRIFLPLKEKRDRLTREIALLSNKLQAGKAVAENIQKLKEAQAQLEEVNEKIEHTTVETGEKVGIEAEVGVGGVAKLGIEASAKKGNKIDLDAIEDAKGDDIGKAGKHGKLAKIGKSVTGYEIAGSVEVGPGSAEITYSRGYQEGVLDSSEIEIAGEFAIPVSNSVAGAIIPPIVDLGARGAEFIRLRVLKSEEENNPSGSGMAANYIMGEALSFSSLQSSESDLLAKIEAYDPDEESDLLEGKVALKISIKGDLHKGGASIELSYVKEMELDAGVVSGKQSKGQRLIKGDIKDGSVKWA